MPAIALIQKYDQPVPRYTSYPTVPHWNTSPPTAEAWLDSVKLSIADNQDISLYIHLPFCEKLCTYCACNKRITRNHQVERPYLDAVLQEWQLYLDHLPVKPRIKTLHLGGGTPTFFSPDNLAYLLNSIFSSVERAPDHEFSFEAHPANTTRQHLEILKSLGFDRLSIGVQDFDDDILKLINRQQTAEQVYRVNAMARELGYSSVNFDLIFGLPRQTKAHIARNMEKVRELRPDRIAFYSYAHVPWRNPSQRAYDETDLPLGSDKRALYEYGKEQLEAMDYQEVGMDHFALPSDPLIKARREETLHRNFMGYTDRYTALMIGLGASSISDSGRAFIQNEKSVESYQAMVAQGELPIIKGHLLSEEDRRLRQHILNLSCRFYTHWTQEDTQLSRWSDIQRQLAHLEADGLLINGLQELIVTPVGRPFIRNICSALDAHLQQKANEVQFSQSI
jgi:oxygen-independent coproporphyrinogen-3 oxidase